MDIRSIIAPTITDPNALEEFIESLHDLAPDIERDVSRLKNAPGDRDILGSLFRAMHNIKGDATLCRVELAVAIAHPIETLLARLRNGEINFSDTLAEAVLLAIDRLELAVESLRAQRPLENLRLLPLVQELERLADAPPSSIKGCASDLIEAVTGFRPAGEGATLARRRTQSSISRSPSQTSDDLRFFRSLADQLESRSALFKGRTLRLLRLATETNQIKGKTVDPAQLEAAVYLHDIGMMFLPESVWLKVGGITPEEKALLHNHPGYAAGLLSRITGWEDAAEMVAQHHEMPDGQGYPEGLHADQINDGAKILAIVDAFESVMLKHAHRGKNRSVLRAIAEINACDNQFSPEWIEPFNQVIHRSVNQ
jgi:HD-GYP domain-containing protein (c-di-GMP phosphodiesterase class II)